MLDRVSMDEDQLVFDTQSLSMLEIHEFLRNYGCHSPEKLDLIGNDLYLLEPSAWDEGYVPFFANVESMWHTVRTRKEKPKHIILVGIESEQTASILRAIQVYFLLRDTLKKLCHNSESESQTLKYVLYNSKESSLIKTEISYLIEFGEFLSIRIEEEEIKQAQTMHAAVMADDDIHCEERRHVMRESLIDFLKNEKDCNIRLLIASISSLYKKYNERYKVYISKFSVNKILSEIESDCLSFLGKVQDAITSQQTKAFAVPGGIVAAGAILKPATTIWDYLVIIAGLVISTWMITSLNRNVNAHINLLADEFDRSTIKYNEIVVGIEDIQEKIKTSKEKLLIHSNSAKSKLSTLTNVCWLTLLLISLILLKRFLEGL